MARRFDVSMPLFAGMPAFPGDPLFGSDAVRRIERGDPYSLSRLGMGSHTGTHVDPPSHFVAGAPSIDRIDLSALNGPCEVVEVPSAAASVGLPELDAIPREAARVLFRTANSRRWAARLEFFPDYVALDRPAAVRLAERSMRLVGIDALSIESDPTGKYPVHRELLSHGVLILEGLLLDTVSPGRYRLECLPLRLRDGDGGPARAVLVAE